LTSFHISKSKMYSISMNSQVLEPSKQTYVDIVQQVMSVRLEYCPIQSANDRIYNIYFSTHFSPASFRLLAIARRCRTPNTVYVEGKIACLPAALNFADVSSLLQYPQSNLRSPCVVLSDLSFDLRRKIGHSLATPKCFR
jgi:hypothetical protein